MLLHFLPVEFNAVRHLVLVLRVGEECRLYSKAESRKRSANAIVRLNVDIDLPQEVLNRSQAAVRRHKMKEGDVRVPLTTQRELRNRWKGVGCQRGELFDVTRCDGLNNLIKFGPFI
jgi:hypothetical protein